MVGHGLGDGGLGDLGYGVVGHRVHGRRNHGHGDGVHGDGDCEDNVCVDSTHLNYDYEGAHGSHWCQNEGDGILTLEGAMVEELLLKMVDCLSNFCLLGAVGI